MAPISVAPSLKLKVPAEATVQATVGIGPRSEGGFGITADLKVDLPGLDKADAQRLVDAAHQVCPLLESDPQQSRCRS